MNNIVLNMTNSIPIIRISNVSLTYEGRNILNSIHFELHRGEFCYLIGNTGSGKSSLLKLIYRDALPTEGEVFVDQVRVDKLKNRDIPALRRKLGIVFQDFQLLHDRNVFDNIAFAMEITGKSRKQIKEKTLEVLHQVGLAHKQKSKTTDLSGGEQQRVVIARALANEPEILLADEPTGNLDPSAAESIMEVLKQINKRGMAVLMVTHDHTLVKKYPYRTLQIEEGRLMKTPSYSRISEEL